jgi:hypothetical protein
MLIKKEGEKECEQYKCACRGAGPTGTDPEHAPFVLFFPLFMLTNQEFTFEWDMLTPEEHLSKYSHFFNLLSRRASG